MSRVSDAQTLLLRALDVLHPAESADTMSLANAVIDLVEACLDRHLETHHGHEASEAVEETTSVESGSDAPARVAPSETTDSGHIQALARRDERIEYLRSCIRSLGGASTTRQGKVERMLEADDRAAEATA